MEENKVTIVVPIYNVKDYLEFCMESILNQTYKNIEVILVDDGSTDGSSKLCDLYKEKDSRIDVIHKKNGGLASARNAGIFKATGKYIVFIDSDDFISKYYIEVLVNNICKSDYQLAMCKLKRVNSHQLMEQKNIERKCYTVNTDEMYQKMIIEPNISGYATNKLYVLSIIKKMKKYFLNVMLEDMEFNSRYFELCKKACIIDEFLYYYYYNSNGITGKTTINKKNLTAIEVYNSVYKIYTYECSKFADLILYEKLKFLLNMNYKNKISKNKVDFEFKDSELLLHIIKSKNIKNTKKIYITVSYFFPITTSKIKFSINNFVRKLKK